MVGEIRDLETAAFRGGNQGALFALGRDLGLHGQQNFLGRRQVLDLVAQYLHTPVERRLIDGLDDLGIDDVALLEGLVQLQLADHAAQRGLGQLRDGHDVVGRAVAGAHRVRHLKVQDAVHLQLGVVTRDADLAGHIQRDFLQAVLVGDTVDEGDQEVQSRCE